MGVRAAGLCAAKVRTAAEGRYGDGDGLYVVVRPSGSAYWLFRYTRAKKMREMGLGRARGRNAVSLVEARTKARDLHLQVRGGLDPLSERLAAQAEAKSVSQQALVAARTFKQAAEDYLESRGAEWRSAKHSKQWPNTLKTYVYPHFGNLPVAAVTTSHVLAALTPIWTTKTETASRVRGRIETILDAEKVRGNRSGENPALWKGHLAHVLSSPGKIAPVENQPALPFVEAPMFFRSLLQEEGIGARALEFTILTAARSAMTFRATWGEIDFPAATWNVPAEHMKGKKPFRIPLSKEAIAVLEAVAPMRETSQPECLIFPGASDGHISDGTMLAVLKRMGRGDITVHGFRSTCRDWISECTQFPSEVGEMVLAHAIDSKVEAAYRRGELFLKRQDVMARWGVYCGYGEQPGPLPAG